MYLTKYFLYFIKNYNNNIQRINWNNNNNIYIAKIIISKFNEIIQCDN